MSIQLRSSPEANSYRENERVGQYICENTSMRKIERLSFFFFFSHEPSFKLYSWNWLVTNRVAHTGRLAPKGTCP